MCGIIYAENYKHGEKEAESVNKTALYMLEDQISRGKEGFGVVFIQEDGSFSMDRATEMNKLLFDMYVNTAPAILLHHRNPSSSKNTIKQTHPMLIQNKVLKHDYLVIHNGIITNSHMLKIEHEKAGFKYRTEEVNDGKEEFNDSESLAIELACYIDGNKKSIEVSGAVAFIMLKIDKESQKVLEVIYARESNPLRMCSRKGEIRIASEGKGNEVKRDMLYIMDFKTKKIRKTPLINSYVSKYREEKSTIWTKSEGGVIVRKKYSREGSKHSCATAKKEPAEKVKEGSRVGYVVSDSDEDKELKRKARKDAERDFWKDMTITEGETETYKEFFREYELDVDIAIQSARKKIKEYTDEIMDDLELEIMSIDGWKPDNIEIDFKVEKLRVNIERTLTNMKEKIVEIRNNSMEEFGKTFGADETDTQRAIEKT